MANILNGIFWFLVLWFISFFVAGFLFIPYLIVSVLTPCCPGLQGLADLLLACINFPHKCSENMMSCNDCCAC